MGSAVAFSSSRDLYAVLAYFISACRLVHVRETNRTVARVWLFFLSLRCRSAFAFAFVRRQSRRPPSRPLLPPQQTKQQQSEPAAEQSSRPTHKHTHTPPSPPTHR